MSALNDRGTLRPNCLSNAGESFMWGINTLILVIINQSHFHNLHWAPTPLLWFNPFHCSCLPSRHCLIHHRHPRHSQTPSAIVVVSISASLSMAPLTFTPSFWLSISLQKSPNLYHWSLDTHRYQHADHCLHSSVQLCSYHFALLSSSFVQLFNPFLRNRRRFRSLGCLFIFIGVL